MRKDEYHIIPMNDSGKHIESPKCKCRPKIEEDEFTFCITHKSYDGREGLEMAQKELGLESDDPLKVWSLIKIEYASK